MTTLVDSYLKFLLDDSKNDSIVIEGVDEDPNDGDFMDEDPKEVEKTLLEEDVEMSKDCLEDKFDLLKDYDAFGADGIETYVQTHYPDSPQCYISKQKYTRAELFPPSSIYDPLPVKEIIEEEPFLKVLPFRFQRSYVIVNHPEFHKEAKLEHVFLAQKVFKYFDRFNNLKQEDREKMLNDEVDREPEWTKFLLSVVVEDCGNFILYMLK